MFAIVLIWFLISVPLSVAGSFFGFRRPILEPPVRTNQIPRQIPEQVVYLRPIPSILLSGVLPFGAIFVEFYFIMNSIWFHKAYYMFGFLFVCYFIMVRDPSPPHTLPPNTTPLPTFLLSLFWCVANLRSSRVRRSRYY